MEQQKCRPTKRGSNFLESAFIVFPTLHSNLNMIDVVYPEIHGEWNRLHTLFENFKHSFRSPIPLFKICKLFPVTITIGVPIEKAVEDLSSNIQLISTVNILQEMGPS